MSIDLNKYHIEVSINDLRRKKVFIKLPITEKSLELSLINNNVSEEPNYINLDSNINSVIDIKKVNNVVMKKPINIYYLNMYLNILKQKNIDFASEKIEINTATLKEKISCLIDTKNKELNYDEIKKILEEKNQSKEMTTPIKKAPIFSIKDLQREHIERKATNGKKEKDS